MSALYGPAVLVLTCFRLGRDPSFLVPLVNCVLTYTLSSVVAIFLCNLPELVHFARCCLLIVARTQQQGSFPIQGSYDAQLSLLPHHLQVG